MPKSFTITSSATDALQANAQGHAQVVFTVTNTAARPMRGMARLKALENAKPDWLRLSGESERDFPPGGTQQFDVSFDAPPSATAPAAAQQCSFRLDVASAMNPDEDYTESPVVIVKVAPVTVDVKKPTSSPLKWIIPAAAVLLIIIGIVLWLLLRTKKYDVPNVVGKPVAEANTLLADAKLKSNVRETKVTGTVGEGMVAEQSPASGSVAEGTTIDLVVEAPKPVKSTQRVNVAIDKNAKQSTTVLNALASRAVDGNTNGNWAAGSVTHTDATPTPWWEVDLGEVVDIANIRVWNRTDCCGERLSNFYVLVSEKPFAAPDLNSTINQPGVSAFPAPSQGGTPSIFSIGKPGRYVRVQLVGTNNLSLAEVEIMADVVSNEPSGLRRPGAIKIPGR